MGPARCAPRRAGPLAALTTRPVVVALLVALLVVLWVPGTASAEGPGYGGTADQLSVAWQPDAIRPAGDIVVSGVGFLAGSEVVVRVGDGTERTAVVDQTGTLTMTVESAGSAAFLPDGTSIMAVGQNPGGTTLTLVGFVPPRSGNGGGQSRTSQILIISVLLAGLASALVPGLRGRLVVAVAGGLSGRVSTRVSKGLSQRLSGRTRPVRVERVEYAPRGYHGCHGRGYHGSKR